MGRIWAILDPPGYTRTDEPGLPLSFTGPELLAHYENDDFHKRYSQQFYNPPGSDWILPKPKQWNPDWYKDAAFPNSLLDLTRWVFASGLGSTPVEHEVTAVGGETGFPNNKWITIPYVDAGATSIDATSYVNLGTAAGIDLTGFKTVAIAAETPVTATIRETFHPFVQFLHMPAPYNKVVFGWGRYAFVLTGAQFAMVETLDGGTSWRLLAEGALGGEQAKTALQTRGAGGFTAGGGFVRAQESSLLVMPVGLLGEVYLHFVTGGVKNTLPVRLQQPLSFLNTNWWIGAGAGQHVSFQPQVVAYNDATLPGITGPYAFDMGGDYTPTVAPAIISHGVIYANAPSEIVEVKTSNSDTLTVSSTNQQSVVQLRDEAGDLWVSDGSHTRGRITVALFPGSGPGGQGFFLTPQIRRVEVEFPPKVVARVNTQLNLSDEDFQTWWADTGLRSPEAKQGELRFWDLEAAILATGGATLSRRGSFPIHFVEDLDGDGDPDQEDPDALRARGWVTEPRLQVVGPEDQVKADGSSRAEPLQQYALKFGPLLKRADTRWYYKPRIVNADATHVDHTYAVGRILFQKGFDLTDTALVFIHTDPFAGSAISYLPGGPGEETGAAGVETTPPYWPTEKQSGLAYLRLISEGWSGWLLYEGLRQVRYHPDLPYEGLLDALGGQAISLGYYRSASVYLQQSDAAAFGVAGQYALAPALEKTPQEPVCNYCRVNGVRSDGGSLPAVIDKAPETWETPSTDENWIGDILPESIDAKVAVSATAAMKVARLVVMKGKRRIEAWQVDCPRAPWDFDEPVDVGQVVEFQGRGDHLITHLRVTQLARGQFRTHLVGEKLPGTMTQAGSAGAYPGVGA